MRDYINIYKVSATLLMLLSAAVMFVACSEDSDSVERDTDMLQLVPYTSEMVESSPATTRAVSLPTGYTEYIGPNSIGVYTTTADEAPEKIRTFLYINNAWNSQVSVTNSTQYYIYGYMPVNDNIKCTISQRDTENDFSKGAVLSFNDPAHLLPPVMAEDFSVITGVLQVSSANPTESVNLTSGKFSYKGKASGSNYVCLMLDHLYSCVRFNFQVDDNYSKLRTIVLKEVQLKTENTLAYPLTVTMKADEAHTVTWGTGTSFTTDFVKLFPRVNESEVQLPTVSNTDESKLVKVDGYFAPVADVANSLILDCKYDVYDKKVTQDRPYGNLVRQNCEATNKLPNLVAGLNQRTTLTLTVNPTYLYVLSDPDLDNPTVVVN